MAIVMPLRGLRYDPEKAGSLDTLCAPPYDVISFEQASALTKLNPHNIISIEKPDGGAYEAAAELLDSWIDSGVLKREDKPCFYLYEAAFNSPDGKPMSFRGLIARLKLSAFSEGVVLPHEETLSGPKKDRFELYMATRMNISSLYGLYKDPQGIVAALCSACAAGKPDASVVMPDGCRHSLWLLSGEAEISAITKAFADKQIYIADGHHRYDTALAVRDSLRETGECADSEHPANYAMFTLVEASDPGLLVLPTHRVGTGSFDAEKLLNKLSEHFEAVKLTDKYAIEDAIRGKAYTVGMYTGEAYTLTLRDPDYLRTVFPDSSDAYRGLDVALLHGAILSPYLGVDAGNLREERSLSYTRDAKEAVGLVDSGKAQYAFFLNATQVEQICGVADARENMPQKSTYFYPKLITGLVMSPIS